MNKIKILFVHQNLDIGGAEVLRKHVLSYLNKERYEADVCCIERRGRIGEEIETLGCRVIVLDRKINIFNSPFILWKLYRLIKKNKYDVIQSSLFYANFFGRVAGILARTPLLIIEEHGIFKWKNKYSFFIWIDKFLARFTYRIICCSESVRDFTANQEGISNGKFLVLRNCLNFNSLDIPETKDEIRNRHFLRQDETIIGIVGVIKKEKGHLYLIDALNILSKKYKNLRLLIVGDGLLSDDIKERVDNLGINSSVLFLGWRDNIPQLLKAMDIFVLPSVSEGLGIALLEAMYMRLPVVASDVDGIPEIIYNEINGLLVPPKDSELLASAIEKLILDIGFSKRLGSKAREMVVKDFSAQKYTTEIENIYTSFFNRRKG